MPDECYMAGAPSGDPLPPDLQAARDEDAVRIAAWKESFAMPDTSERLKTCETAEIIEFVTWHPTLRDLISSLVDDDECSIDHHGGCQTHHYWSLLPGELCPNEEAKRLVEEAKA